jgi:hypothetical protein
MGLGDFEALTSYMGVVFYLGYAKTSYGTA